MDQVTKQILFIKWVLRRDMSSAPAGGALRASSSLVELRALRASPSLLDLSGRLLVW